MAALKKTLPQKKAGRKARLTAAQERWFIRVFPILSNKAIADKLTTKSKVPYTEAFIARQGHRLKLTKERVKYSQDDLRFIENNINTLSWQQIADHLKRTPGALRKKWHELKDLK